MCSPENRCRPLVQGESLLPKLFPLLRLLPGVSYLRALEVVALLPGEAELDLKPGALDDGRQREVTLTALARVVVDVFLDGRCRSSWVADLWRACCQRGRARPQSRGPYRGPRAPGI